MAVKRVFSAGGIVLRRFAPQDKQSLRSSQAAGLKFSRKDGVKVLLTQHSKHKGWEFPKGHLEAGESSEQAALREVEEEAGVRAEVLEKAGEIQYFYYESKVKIFKTVNYFFMKYLGEGEATTKDEVSDKKWLAVDEVEEQLTFKSSKEMWVEAKKRVEQSTVNL